MTSLLPCCGLCIWMETVVVQCFGKGSINMFMSWSIEVLHTAKICFGRINGSQQLCLPLHVFTDSI